jgi:ketosteroid isomerase-like protein
VSAADVEHIRKMIETFNRGERAESMDFLHEEVELYQWSDLPDPGVYKGRDEWVRGLRRWLEEFEPDFQFRIDELTDAGDCVLAELTLHGKGRTSGVELDQKVFHIYEVRDGKTFRCRVFSDESDARKQAGLEAERG